MVVLHSVYAGGVRVPQVKKQGEYSTMPAALMTRDQCLRCAWRRGRHSPSNTQASRSEATLRKCQCCPEGCWQKKTVVTGKER